MSDAEQWVSRLVGVGIDAKAKRADRVTVRLTAANLTQNEEVIRDLIHQCVSESEA